MIKLEQNYRSSGRILKAANILIANNPHVFEKRLFSELGYGAELKVLSANNEDHEAERVAGELIAHHFINKTNYKDYAILYRGNHQSRVFEKMLMQNRIPYKISGGTSFFSRPEIKDLLAYLRVLTNPDDDSAFLRIVNTPKREIGPATLQKLGEWAMGRNKGLFTASFDMGLSQTLTGRGYDPSPASPTGYARSSAGRTRAGPLCAIYSRDRLRTGMKPRPARKPRKCA
ncbi:MAG: 3'-5' exonuclease [Klebsiella pneumoniae]